MLWQDQLKQTAHIDNRLLLLTALDLSVFVWSGINSYMNAWMHKDTLAGFHPQILAWIFVLVLSGNELEGHGVGNCTEDGNAHIFGGACNWPRFPCNNWSCADKQPLK